MKSILRQITELGAMTLAELKARWLELYGSQAPGYSRAYLVRRLAYRVQELAHGGVPDATRARLRQLIDEGRQDATGGPVARLTRRRRKDGMPVPGTRLVREWRGQRYEVTVVAGGFEYEGRRYRSLTAVAKAMGAGHRNGRAFFGLRQAGEGRDA